MGTSTPDVPIPARNDSGGLSAAGGFSGFAAAAFGRLLVVAGALDFAREAFALAQPLKTAKKLLDGFVASGFYLKHCRSSSSKISTQAAAKPVRGQPPASSPPARTRGLCHQASTVCYLIDAPVTRGTDSAPPTQNPGTAGDPNCLAVTVLQHDSAPPVATLHPVPNHNDRTP